MNDIKCPVCGHEQTDMRNEGCPSCGFPHAFIQYFADGSSLDAWNAEVSGWQAGRLQQRIQEFNERFTLSMSAGRIAFTDRRLGTVTILDGNAKKSREYTDAAGCSLLDRKSCIISSDGSAEITDENGKKTVRGNFSASLCTPYCTYLLGNDGKITICGIPLREDIRDWSNIIEISAGYQHILGLERNGRVHIVAASSEYRDAEKQISSWQNIKMIKASGKASFGLREDGCVMFVGSETDKRSLCCDWRHETLQIAADSSYAYALLKDGTVKNAGHCLPILDRGRSNVSSWKGMLAIHAEESFVIGIDGNGELLAAGIIQADEEWLKAEWHSLIRPMIGIS